MGKHFAASTQLRGLLLRAVRHQNAEAQELLSRRRAYTNIYAHENYLKSMQHIVSTILLPLTILPERWVCTDEERVPNADISFPYIGSNYSGMYYMH